MHARRLLRFLIILAGVATLTGVVTLSHDRRAYSYYTSLDREAWSYPLGFVVLVSAFVVAETAVSYLAVSLAPQNRLWVGSLLALLVLGPWLFFLGLRVIHMPGFYLVNLVWVVVLVAFHAALALASGVTLLVRNYRLARVATLI